MNSLDRIIRRERIFRYKRLRKLRKARDMSKKYRKKIIKLSKVDKYFNSNTHQEMFLGTLARYILAHEGRLR